MMRMDRSKPKFRQSLIEFALACHVEFGGSGF